jgi:lipopolysaccharide transport system permease protein
MKWQWEIKPETAWFDVNLKELWTYRHLLLRLIRRDFLTLYQQTLLGPAWVVIQPLITVLMYVLVFDRIVEIPIAGRPPVLFYMAGVIVWNLFAETFNSTVFTFTTNATLFSKVYFPRLIIPFSVTASHIIRFLIQFGLFLIFYGYHLFKGNVSFNIGAILIALPLTIVVISIIALGAGLCFAVFIAKYRDIGNLLQLCVRLLMFATPVLYPLSFVDPHLAQILIFNPLVPMVEFFRFAFLGHGVFTVIHLVYSGLCMLFAFLVGTILFNKMGAKLIDVV